MEECSAIQGQIRQFKKGFGIVAKESEAKLIPVVIEGAYQAWPRTSKFPKRHPIRVKFGKPLDIESVEEKGYKSGAKNSYEAVCVAGREALIELKNKKQLCCGI